MTTEYTTYACNTCGARFAGNLSTKCPMCTPVTEERVRSLIAEALTEKEEHIRRIWREEHAKHVKRLVSEKDLLEQTRDEALEEAASVSNGYVYEPCCFAAVESMSKRIRALKHTRPDQARQGEEALHKAPNLGPDLGDRTERPSPASSLRKFIEAADTLKERLLIVAPGSFTERYDTARSRIDVDEIVRLKASAEEMFRLYRDKDVECRNLSGKVLDLRTELSKANEALDELAAEVSNNYIDFEHTWDRCYDIIKRTGRLGGSK